MWRLLPLRLRVVFICSGELLFIFYLICALTFTGWVVVCQQDGTQRIHFFLFPCFLQHASVDREGRSARRQVFPACMASLNTLTVAAKIPGVPRLPGLGCVFPNNHNVHDPPARRYTSISTLGISEEEHLSTYKSQRWIISNLPCRFWGWLVTGEELSPLRSDAELSPQEAWILRRWSNAEAVVAVVWHGHTRSSLGFHAESLKHFDFSAFFFFLTHPECSNKEADTNCCSGASVTTAAGGPDSSRLSTGGTITHCQVDPPYLCHQTWPGNSAANVSLFASWLGRVSFLTRWVSPSVTVGYLLYM